MATNSYVAVIVAALIFSSAAVEATQESDRICEEEYRTGRDVGKFVACMSPGLGFEGVSNTEFDKKDESGAYAPVCMQAHGKRCCAERHGLVQDDTQGVDGPIWSGVPVVKIVCTREKHCEPEDFSNCSEYKEHCGKQEKYVMDNVGCSKRGIALRVCDVPGCMCGVPLEDLQAKCESLGTVGTCISDRIERARSEGKEISQEAAITACTPRRSFLRRRRNRFDWRKRRDNKSKQCCCNRCGAHRNQCWWLKFNRRC